MFTTDRNGDGINDSDDDGTYPLNEPNRQSVLCIYRGSQRRCCEHLYLCRKFPGESCTPYESYSPELRSCLTCELHEPVTEP